MINKKSKFSTFIIFLLFLPNFSYAKEIENCELKNGFELYKCQIKKNCINQEFNNKKPLIKSEDYKPVKEYKNDPDYNKFWQSDKQLYPLRIATKKYQTNQNKIYKCAILEQQRKSLNLIKKLLVIDRTWALRVVIKNKIDQRIKALKPIENKLKCIKYDNVNLSKKQVLDNTTLEMCKFIYYTEYLNDYYQNGNLKNTIPIKDEEFESSKSDLSIWILDFPNNKEKFQKEIKKVVEHTYKLYDLSFNAYTEYWYFLPIHIWLELIKEDVIVFRQKLYKAIYPLNQVVYKIINAMSY